MVLMARTIPANLADRFRGYDEDGDIVIVMVTHVGTDFNDTVPMLDDNGNEYLIALTPCCNASGKGGGMGVICRKCHRDVDGKYGGFVDADDLVKP
jgi:hypothetical protein